MWGKKALCWFTFLLVLCTVLSPATGKAADKLVVPYSSIGGASVPIWLPKDAGLYAKYGLDVQLIYIATSTRIMQATIAGEVDLSYSGEEAAMSANLGGVDIVILASGVDHLPFSLYAKPTYTRVEQLRGKKVGVSRFGSSTDFTGRYILSRHGLTPGRDVVLLQTGGVANTFAALKSGAIDAGVFSPPSTVYAAKLGFRELVNMGDEPLEMYAECLTARREWIEKNQDKLRRFLKAYVEGIATIKKDKQLTIQVMRKYTRTANTDILAATYDYFIRILPRDPTPSAKAVENVLRIIAVKNPAVLKDKPGRFMEPKYMEELRDSGFIDRLYR